MAQARARRGPGTAVVAADDDRVGLGLDDAGSDGADTGAGRQFYADGSPAIGIFQIEDEFGQVFNGVDVVMRRR